MNTIFKSKIEVYEPSAACKAEQLREAGKMSADDVLKAAGRLGEEIKNMDYAVEG